MLSARRTASAPAAAISALSRIEQDFVLHWVVVIARTNIELAFQFAVAAPEALALLDLKTAEGWVIGCVDTYDREGLHGATSVLRNPGAYLARVKDRSSVELESVLPVLRLFAQALGGRRLRIEPGSAAFTDSGTIYLPSRMSRAATEEDNFLVYKASVAMLWAQIRYGTFNADITAACAQFREPDRALALFGALETIRLAARLSKDLPALARRISVFQSAAGVEERCRRLLDRDATVLDTLDLVRQLYEAPPRLPDALVELRPDLVATVRDERIERERSELAEALAQLLGTADQLADPHACADASVAIERNERGEFVVCVRGEAVPASPELSELLDSIEHDIGEIPDAYLSMHESPSTTTASAPPRSVHAPTFRYDEWDCVRGHYRKAWCTLRELDVDPGDAAFVERTQSRYAAKIAHLRRTFELMRGEDRVLKRQPDGDAFDLDAVIESFAEMHAGAEAPPLLFTKRRRHERDLAVMIMVDMSGSTKGWVNEAEREALVMLCEALEVLGDRYAIYGFSGVTRSRCETYRVKRFDEPYDEAVRERIAGIEPQNYTRMGAPIRHLTMRLNEVQARTKLLITLSDGKPDDYSDAYRGEYGVEDTRRALIEAQRTGVRPFCVTIDREARDYLPHMYGAANWTLIDDVARLPLKIADVYRRLTT